MRRVHTRQGRAESRGRVHFFTAFESLPSLRSCCRSCMTYAFALWGPHQNLHHKRELGYDVPPGRAIPSGDRGPPGSSSAVFRPKHLTPLPQLSPTTSPKRPQSRTPSTLGTGIALPALCNWVRDRPARRPGNGAQENAAAGPCNHHRAFFSIDSPLQK